MGGSTQETLDSAQYRRDSMLQYERVYGRDFVSPGDAEVARVEVDDRAPRFIDRLGREVERIERLDIDAAERESLLASWRKKIDRARGGDHRRGLFRAVKPDTAES